MSAIALPVVSNNENASLCSSCGDCCKRLPGSYHPAQFGPELEGVEELLRAGKASIDWWDGVQIEVRDPRTEALVRTADLEHKGFFLRPAVVPGTRPPSSRVAMLSVFSAFLGNMFGADPNDDRAGEVFDPTYGGRCVELTDRGCGLPFERRPLECQSLVPNPDKAATKQVNCYGDPEHGKAANVIAWGPYSERLYEIGKTVAEEKGQRADS